MFGLSKSAVLIDRSHRSDMLGKQIAVTESVTREEMEGERRRLARIALSDLGRLAEAVTKTLPGVISQGSLSLPHVGRVRELYEAMGEALKRLEAQA